MPFEAQFAVKGQRGRVLVHHFQMKRSHVERAGGVFEESHGLASPAPAAIFGAQVELVDEGVAAQPFEAVAEAENDVSDWDFGFRFVVFVIPFAIVGFLDFVCVGEDEPYATETWIAQQGDQGSARFLLVEGVAIEGVVVAHEREQSVGVRFCRQAE